jgi:hypothetical protein
MSENQLPKPSPEVYTTFIKNGGFSNPDLDFLNSYDWSVEVFDKNGLYGLKSCIGELLLNPIIQEFLWIPFYDMNIGDKLVAKLNNKFGIIQFDGADGVWIIEPEYDYIGFPGGITSFIKERKWGVMDILTKEWILPLNCDFVYEYEGCIFINGIGKYEIGGKWGIILENGEITGAIYDEVALFNLFNLFNLLNEDYATARIGDLWGYVAKDGQLVQDTDKAYFHALIE